MPSRPGIRLAPATEPLSEAQIAGYRAVAAADSSRRLAPRSVGLLAGQDTLTVPDIDTKLAAQVAGLGCGFLPAFLAASDVAAGRLVIKAVEPPRATVRLHAAWREARPGRALAWWIAAVTQTDWRFLALGPTPDPDAPARKPHHGAARGPERGNAGRQLELVRGLGQTAREQRRQFERLVLADLVLHRERREEAAVHAPGDIVPRRNGQERARVVVEARPCCRSRRSR